MKKTSAAHYRFFEYLRWRIRVASWSRRDSLSALALATLGVFLGTATAHAQDATLYGIPHPVAVAASAANQIWVASASDGSFNHNTGAMYRVNAANTAILGQKNLAAYYWGIGSPVGANGTIYVFGQNTDHSFDLIAFNGNTGVTTLTLPNFIHAGSYVYEAVYDQTSNSIFALIQDLGFNPFWVVQYYIPTGLVKTFNTPFQAPRSLGGFAVDGVGHFWVAATANFTFGSAISGQNISDGGTYKYYPNAAPGPLYSDLIYGSGNLWAVDSLSNMVLAINPTTGVVWNTIDFGPSGTSVDGLAWDGNCLFANDNGQTMYKFRLDGTGIGFYQTDTVGDCRPVFVPASAGGGGAVWSCGYQSFNTNRVSVAPGT